jgi:lipopolysaccharide biosynthesis regulator YciM
MIPEQDQAVLGRSAESARDMDAADAALAQAGTHSADFFDHWDETRVAGFRGNCAVLLGESDQAVSILEKVARTTDRSLVGPYTAVLTDLATAYAQRGEVDHACGILGDVLVTAQVARMPERAERVRRARNSHLRRYAHTQAVHRLDNHLLHFMIDR